jgi:ribosomal protein S10
MPDEEDRPATLRDLTAAEQRIVDRFTGDIAAAQRQTVDQLRGEIAAARQQTVEQLTETMRDMQSEILRGFETFARGNFVRLHTLESNQADVNLRLAVIEERLLNLETRRPPQ